MGTVVLGAHAWVPPCTMVYCTGMVYPDRHGMVYPDRHGMDYLYPHGMDYLYPHGMDYPYCMALTRTAWH